MKRNPSSHRQAIELSGEYDLARRHELSTSFETLATGRPVWIDMQRVTFIDSTFLGVLAALRVRLKENPVTLVGVRPNIARVLALAKFDRLFVFIAGIA